MKDRKDLPYDAMWDPEPGKCEHSGVDLHKPVDTSRSEREQWRSDFAGKLLMQFLHDPGPFHQFNEQGHAIYKKTDFVEESVEWTDLLLEALEKK